jgi:predicted ester cyclase
MDPEASKAFITRYMDTLRQDTSQETLDRFIADEELKQHIAMYEASFPGYWIEADDLIAEGDRVALRGKVRGVHKGALMGIPPTGREISLPLFIMYRLAGGKIVQHWMVVDTLELLRQLGQAPGVPTAA